MSRADSPMLPRPRRVLAALIVGAALFGLDVLRVAPREHLVKAMLLGFASALVKFLLWGGVGMLVWRLLWRYPIEGRPGARTLGIHVTAALVLSAAATVLATGAQYALRPALLATLSSEAPVRLLASWTAGLPGELGAALAMTFPWDLLAYWALFAGLAFLHWALRASEQRRRALTLAGKVSQAQLRALETQLRPHFLFNALNTIVAILHRDGAEAQAITRRLRGLFTQLLETKDRPLQSLQEERRLLEDYLAIQKARFGERLRPDVEIGPGCEGALVPSFLLQPLVENAIRHGAAGRAGPTRIRVRARRVGDRVELEVHDDGPGCAGDAASGRDGGVGISNTRQRLQLLYGDRHELEVKGRAGPWGGFRVRMVVPYEEVGAARLPVAEPRLESAGPARPPYQWLLSWWLFFAAMFVLNLVWASARYYAHSRAAGVTWLGEVAAGARGGGAHVLLFPLVYWVNRRLVARTHGLAGRVALHVACALGLSLAKASLLRAVALLLGGAQAGVSLSSLVLLRIYADLLHYAVMAGLCHALAHYHRQRAQALQTARLEAELGAASREALRRQLQPELLLRALEQIEGLIGRAPAQADELVVSLAARLRLILDDEPPREAALARPAGA